MNEHFDSGVVVFLCGDVMTGRGIDQILPHPGNPALRERVVTDARAYVRLAERANGPIGAPVDVGWPWGTAQSVLDEEAPDIRLINLETSITTAGEFALRKRVHYRMHPANIGCLAAVRPDVCALANNHVLDFGPRGLADTLRALAGSGIRGVGAGLDVEHAQCPAVVGIPGDRRVIITSCGMESSGIPRYWASGVDRPGVALVTDLSDSGADDVAARVLALKRSGDVAVVSVHWGSNWGYDVPPSQVRFAHRLIDAGIDIVHGHSSHHPRPVEVYRNGLVLYGCGDMIDDYEGISGYDAFRHELRLMYFARCAGQGIALRMVPMRMRRMRLEGVAHDDAEWLRATLEHTGQQFATRIEIGADGVLTVAA